ncbi:MAG: hypothetical protein H7A46_12420 [Verrucomicrobiales bacterium]|nr:hypothetical protein [Verrucomicrobiales bacterium]
MQRRSGKRVSLQFEHHCVPLLGDLVVGSCDMRRPITSLLAAIGLAVLGMSLMAPVSGSKAVIRADGQVVRRDDGRPMMVADPYQGSRTNWPAYLILAAGAASFAWTLFLVGYGIVAVATGKTQPGASPNCGPAAPFDNPNITERPPSVS